MNNKLLLLICLLTCLPVLVFSGTTGKISGKVIDKQTGDPLPAVNVVIDGTLMGAATDINGEYFILNVPVGTYKVRARMVGYKDVLAQNVRVKVDLTTRQDFELVLTVLEGEEVTIVAERPLIPKDLTSTRSITTGAEMVAAPLEDITDAVGLTAGVSGGNFRGGREGEAVYMLDGVALVDPMSGDFESDVPIMALEEMSVETGGFSAEYGNVQSGVVNMVLKEGGTDYSGSLRYKTNDFGDDDFNRNFIGDYTTLLDKKDNKAQTASIKNPEQLKNLEYSFGGPEPITKYLLKGVPGTANFFISGELYDSQGQFPGLEDKKGSVTGKLTYKPNASMKLAFTGLKTWRERGFYDHEWKNTTYESMIDSTNERTVGKDLNGDGVIGGWIPGMDLNHDGDIGDAFSMLDHLPNREYNTEELSLNWTHQLSAKTFYEVKLSRYLTKFHYNIDENINEDTDGDGHLDLYLFEDATRDGRLDPGESWQDLNKNGIFDAGKVDIDGDGDKRHEDVNGNLLWDWKIDNGKTDLFRDDNDNGYIDASEIRPRSEWKEWEDLPFGRTRDTNDFYLYGYNENLSYHRSRWWNDYKYTYDSHISITSQITTRQQIKAGIQFKYMEIMQHEVDLASGGNVYGENFTVFPNEGAIYINDKMEYQGMIINLGFRYDYFDANYDYYPSDVTNPVPDSVISSGGIIQNPTKVAVKSNWSPRFGVAYPITENDLLHFNYGKYFQRPILRHAFRNLNFDLSGAFPLIGNANIEPERTTAYEIGVKHTFTTDILLTATGFYKDITGLVDTKKILYTIVDWYGLYVNGDYGSVRGFELSLEKRRTPNSYISGLLNYTFSVAKGKSSSPRQNYEYAWSGDIQPTLENYLDWDERHVVKANIDLRIPEKRNLFGSPILNGLGANVVFNFGSGKPYSPPQRNKTPEINTERLPYTMRTDLTLDKPFTITKDIRLTFFLWINNLFNRKNIDMTNFGLFGDENWYHNYSQIQEKYDNGDMSEDDYISLMDQLDPWDFDGDGIIEEADGKVDDNKKYPEMGSKLDPRVYDIFRTVRLGVSLQF
ncbi:TonB-dependent receptor [candidate division KSB1 bacterium]|nr:TonB-dependent receptor [candidate division KSB1 bacterium]